MGVRGLGERQKKERLLTDSKIVAFLAVSPFTVEQLWRVSRIQRNTLRKRLNDLCTQRILKRHKYSIPYKKEYYGYLYNYRFKYSYRPLYGRNYYLVNLDNHNTTNLILNFCINDYNYSARDFEYGEELPEVLIEEGEKLLQSKKEYLEERSQMTIDKKAVEELKIETDIIIHHKRLRRQALLNSVKYRRERIPIGNISGQELIELTRIVDFFTKKDYSIWDILIRCSCETTIMVGENYVKYNDFSDTLSLGMKEYNTLWEMMKIKGLLKII